jgi:dTDP-4-dehydrorhamnose 3,5-epimerase
MSTDDELTFRPLPLDGAYSVTATRHEDERGWFARSWCATELAAQGLTSVMAQSSFSYNERRGTLRGLHYQLAPHEEAKLVTCVRGAIWDVIVDLRAESPSFRRWYGEELNGETFRALYIPEGFAHGFLTLSDHTLVLYQISEPYAPGAGRGIRWDDPGFSIEWPAQPTVIDERDRLYPAFDDGDAR